MSTEALNDGNKLKHAVDMLGIIALRADQLERLCDETQSNITNRPEDRAEASRTAFLALSLARQIGFIADTAAKQHGGFTIQEHPENWITPNLAISTSSTGGAV